MAGGVFCSPPLPSPLPSRGKFDLSQGRFELKSCDQQNIIITSVGEASADSADMADRDVNKDRVRIKRFIEKERQKKERQKKERQKERGKAPPPTPKKSQTVCASKHPPHPRNRKLYVHQNPPEEIAKCMCIRNRDVHIVHFFFCVIDNRAQSIQYTHI